MCNKLKPIMTLRLVNETLLYIDNDYEIDKLKKRKELIL